MTAREKHKSSHPYSQLPNGGPFFPKPLRRDELVDRHGKPLFPRETTYGEKSKGKDTK